MRRLTICLFVASVAIIALGFGVARIAAQDTTPPVVRTQAYTTIYTSPFDVVDVSCNVLNTTSQDLVVDLRLVFTNESSYDDHTDAHTITIPPKASFRLDRTGLSPGGGLLHCRFTFKGSADQVRATLAGHLLSGGTVSSEAR